MTDPTQQDKLQLVNDFLKEVEFRNSFATRVMVYNRHIRKMENRPGSLGFQVKLTKAEVMFTLNGGIVSRMTKRDFEKAGLLTPAGVVLAKLFGQTGLCIRADFDETGTPYISDIPLIEAPDNIKYGFHDSLISSIIHGSSLIGSYSQEVTLYYDYPINEVNHMLLPGGSVTPYTSESGGLTHFGVITGGEPVSIPVSLVKQIDLKFHNASELRLVRVAQDAVNRYVAVRRN